ncbi:FAD-dependent oxidoreductase domain-containing protein 1-like [Mercenaria mercenaria]|uniref:FAD-dependent oxidoreductase domain-containing protein 1-like n=1 Tax=Mercenaria mercenaria TaxID=6596 RepID=UPI00234F3B74|nr:FAD-dependent oxidoreductase domain-containing protein 1-like [Mercenaria mercenaria]XP_045196958.2 FAD-dependent oxidoreductase domain-containing protein 1-like [Mercenaria mercenaria]
MNHCIRTRLLLKRFRSQLNRLTRQLCDKVPDSRSSDGVNQIENNKQEEREYIPAGGKARSVKDVMMEELKPAFKGQITSIEAPIPRHTDVVILGGGLVGTAVAYFLTQHSSGMYDVTVIERDYAYTRASSMLSAGGIRHQFTIPENVQMSMFTSEFLKQYKEHLSVYGQDPPEVCFHHQGYLFLAPPDRVEFLESCVDMQRKCGAKTVMLSKTQLAEKYPWLNLDGIEAGSLGTSGEGWFDPWQLLHSLKAKNITNNVRYCEGEVVNFTFEEKESATSDGIQMRKKIVGVDVDHKNGKRYGCGASFFINCAGPWAGEIARMAEIGAGEKGNELPLPVEPRKRYVYTIHCPDGPTLDTPFLIDPSGVYFRREGLGGHYICGASPTEENEPNINDLCVDYEFFSDYVWPSLANRVPAFNNSKLKSAWAGYYDYNVIDQNLVIGPHPYHRNLVFANGMSGHGVQQALAIGRAIYELVFYSEYQTIDLSRFHFDRFINDSPLREHAIV